MTDSEKFNIQSGQYRFPYHYLPVLDVTGAISIHKSLGWGLDYLTYMTFITDLIINRINAQSVLDIGCGDGRLLSMLRGRVPRMTGVDLVEQSILFARAFNPDIEFSFCAVSEIQDQYQVTTLVEVLEHIPDKECHGFINNIAAKTLPNGRLIVSVPTTNIPLNKKHFRHYDLHLLKKQLSHQFVIEEYWFLTKKGWTYDRLCMFLQNQVCIMIPRFWRRMIWRLHQRYTYKANAENGMHLVAIAKRII